jgi:predicted transcriptional regulator
MITISTLSNILFDETHKERGRTTLNFKALKKTLEQNKFLVHRLIKGPITSEHLTNAVVLVLACPSGSTFSPEEIEIIRTYVEGGGGLVIMSSSGGDQALQTNLNEINAHFNFSLNDDIVSDESQNVKYNTVPIIQKFPSTPFTFQLKELQIPDTCSIKIGEGSISIVLTSQSATPPNTPLVVTSTYGKGRVVLLGSHKIFQDRVLGGIESAQNNEFARRLFLWASGANQIATQTNATPQPTLEEPPKKEPVESPEQPPPPVSPPLPPETKSKEAPIPEPGIDKALIDELSTKVASLASEVKESISSLSKEVEDIKKQMKKLEQQLSDLPSMVAQPVDITEDPVLMSTGDVAEVIRTSKTERASLLELLEYITQRHQAGALSEPEFNKQRGHLSKEIKRIDKKIAKLENK